MSVHKFSSPCILVGTEICLEKSAACTCPGESHPGPMRSDGSYVGRAAPEIDICETLISDNIGKVRVFLFFHFTRVFNRSQGVNVGSMGSVQCKSRVL